MFLPELPLLALRTRASLLACVLLTVPLALVAGTPRVTSIYPGGGTRGTEAEVTIRGSNIKDARTLLFDGTGVEVMSCVPDAQGVTKVKLKVAPDASLGEHRFRLVTESGISDLRLFFVTPFPMVEERKEVTKGDILEPQAISLNTTVYGRTPGDDQDRFLVELKKGQRLTAEVVAAHLATAGLFDSALSITKEDGSLLAESDDTAFGRQDPIASILAPEDGKYIVTIRESTNLGEGECQYFLHIGTFAQPLALYPPGGPAGEELKVELRGDASGPITQTVKLPAQPNSNFAYYANVEAPAPMPNPFRVSALPNVLEIEPNNDFEHATGNLDANYLAFNGVIDKKGDLDFFKFQAKKGQAVDIAVFARQLRSPLDSVLTLYNEKGVKINSNDDDGQQPDSKLRWTAPTDGAYYISVGDQLNRGDSTFTYRVEITPVEPRVVTYLPEITQNQNQDRRAIVVPKGNRYATLVKIRRTDWAGDVKLEPANLPAGVVANMGEVDKSVDTVAVVFEAKPDAAVEQKLIDLKPAPIEAPKDGPHTVFTVEHLVDVLENANNKAYYTVAEDKLPAAVAESIPVKLTLVGSKVPLLQNGSMNLRIKAERGDYKGPISLALLYVPPGMGSSVVNIKENENEAVMPISANANAPLKTWKVCVVGSADFGKGNTYFSTELQDITVGPSLMDGQIQRTFVDQGDSTTITVKLQAKGEFEGKAVVELQGLPGGCTSEPQEITKDSTEVKFKVLANDKAIVGQHRQLFCSFKLKKDDEEMTNTFGLGGVLRVDKASVAKNTETK